MSEISEGDLNKRIAERIRALRTLRGFTLDALAERSGVSRSMISSIERAESSPTAVLLGRVAAGLGVTLASLFEVQTQSSEPVARLAQQPRWRDPASGYIRRNVSPSGGMSPIQIVDVAFPPGAQVVYETGSRDASIHQQVWMLDGEIDVRVGEDWHHLEAGDCLAFIVNCPTAFHNRSDRTARYAVVIVSLPNHWR
jgi:transcriptional regulator with XRE-family HTH domain